MAGSTDHALTRGGRLKKPSITLWCEWIVKAWNEIDTAIINKAFKKCSIFNALDGSEDSMINEEYSDDESNSDPFAYIDGEDDEDMPQDDI